MDMDVYKSETEQVVNRFLQRELSFPNCISALDAALGRLVPRLHPDEFDALRVVMLANNEAVMNEMARRGSLDEKSKVPTTRPASC